MSHIDPTRRHDFVLLFDVTNGNPNGDPDGGNMPRTDPETRHGLVTDVALKRKIRDYVSLVGEQRIFIQSQVSLNSLIAQAFRETGVVAPQLTVDDPALVEWLEDAQLDGFEIVGNTLTYGGESNRPADIREILLAPLDVRDQSAEVKQLRDKLMKLAQSIATTAKERELAPRDRVQARDRLCQTYFDVRMFGAVLQTGLNAGQVRGPVQLTFARSIDPVVALDLAITRQARTTAARMETGSTEMGRKAIVPYSLYRAHGFFSPALAQQTGVTTDDLILLWEALGRMFEFDRSAARGEMVTRGLYVFTHTSSRGDAPSHKLFERIRVSRVGGVSESRAFTDYQVNIDDQDLPTGIGLNVVAAG